MNRSLLLLFSVLLFASFSLILCSSRSDECHGKDFGSAGQFDFYVVAQSWPADFCASHSSYPGCENPTNWQQNNLTLHGLWPNYNQPRSGHEWPQCCATQFGETITAAEMDPILAGLQLVWPSEQDPNPNGDWSNSLWQHEWGKHGTCSGLPVTKYFQAGINLQLTTQLATPTLISSNIGSSISASSLQAAYNNGQPCQQGSSCMVGIDCSGGNLVSITTCWTPAFAQIPCPSAVIGNQCSGTINIESFGSRKAKLIKQ